MSKLTKEELRKPDQIWQASAKSYSFLKERWIVFGFAVFVVFLGMFTFFYFRQVQQKKEAQAQYLLSDVIALFKQDDVLTEKSVSEEDFNEKLKELRAQYAGSVAYALSGLFEARVLRDEAKYDEALKELRRFEKVLPSSQLGLGLYPKAVLLEDKGDWNEALKTYDEILQLKLKKEENAFRKWALLGKARSLRELNRASESVAVYDEFLLEFPQAPESAKVRGLKMFAERSGTANP